MIEHGDRYACARDIHGANTSSRTSKYLAGRGYRLSPIEQVMAGRITVEQLKLSAGDTARLNRIRQLRDLQYRLRMNRYYNKTLSDDRYRAAISSVHAELSDLGELPGPM